MVHKRKDRPNEGYRVWPTLPKPWGRVGPWQTGFTRKAQAEQVEAWLQDVARSRPEIVDALVSKRFTLEDAWIAKLRGTLDELVAGINDPLVVDAIETYRPECADDRAKSGLSQLAMYAEPGMRLSALKGKAIQSIYRKSLDAGRKPNSVRRSLHRAVTELLAYHLGDEKRLRAFQGVTVPGEDDTRTVRRTAEEIRALVDAAAPDEFRWLLVAAISTAVDRGPLLLMTPRHLNEAEGTASIPDTKTANRARTLRLSDTALLAFRVSARGKDLDERLWPWTPSQVRRLYDATCARAGIEGLRFKDLRHLLPTLMAELGVDRKEIETYLGHAPGSKQTGRYITPTGNTSALNSAAERLGITGANLRAVAE